MNRQFRYRLLLLFSILVAGIAAYGGLYLLDNKYTAALSGGYGYNILQSDPKQPAFLVDGWEYYPGELLSPGAFSSEDYTPTYTYIGKRPNFSADLGSPYGVATYRIHLENPGDPVELTLYLPELLCAGQVYINGVLVGTHGSLTPYTPHVMDAIYTFSAGDSTEIVIQCANYTHYYSGLYYPPAVGTPEGILRMLTARMTVYGFLCFGTLALALYHLIQWLPGRDKTTRQMGLLCLAFGIRVSYPFMRGLGLPWVRPLYALEDVCGSLVLLCAMLLAGQLSQTTSWYHRHIAIPTAVGLCMFTLIFPLFILPYAPFFINFYGLLLFLWKLASGLYLLLLAGQALQADRPLGIYLHWAAGLYGLSVAASVVTANRFEPVYGAWLEEYGGFALVAGFAASMVRREVLLARENKRLTLHLQEEVDRKTKGMETLLTERRELLANLLHDLKNPLSALRIYAELVRSGNVSLDEETEGYLEALTERVEAVENRFDLLQNFSRGERGVFSQENLSLNEILRQFYQSNRPDVELSGVDFFLRLPPTEIRAKVDCQRLQIALENLCYNALSFTPADGSITLSLVKEDRWAVITVQDTGVGIPPEHLPHVFERGFTNRTDDSGEGLGLYIVRTIALEHGGNVCVSSQPGRGSKFTLRLPISQPRGN